MAKISNQQLVLKPQDLFVLLALLSRGEGSVTYPDLAAQTGPSMRIRRCGVR